MKDKTQIQIPFKKSVAYNYHHLFMNPSLSQGHSFRVGWSPTGQFIKIGISNSHLEFCNLINVPPENCVNNGLEKVQKQHEVLLKSHLLDLVPEHNVSANQSPLSTKNSSRRSSLEPYFPLSNPVPKAKILSREGLDQLKRSCEEDKDYFSSHELEVWSLLTVLFVEPEIKLPQNSQTNAEVVEHLRTVVKNKSITNWLIQVTRARTKSRAQFDKETLTPFRNILNCLMIRNLKDACTVAIKSKYLRLATLLSQAGGEPDFQKHIRQQLNQCLIERYSNEIDPDLISIYLLLSGIVLPDSNSEEDIFAKAIQLVKPPTYHQDWITALALQVWYSAFYNVPFRTSLEVYTQAFLAYPEIVSSPFTTYFDKDSLNISHSDGISSLSLDKPYDVMYHLMRLSVDPSYPISEVLDPKGFSTDEMDFRCSWHLAMALNRVPFDRDNTAPIVPLSLQTRLIHQYSFQLQGLGLWQWAIMVLMHLDSSSQRATAIKKVLNRHITLAPEDAYSRFTSGQELKQGVHLLLKVDRFLIEDLGVPAQWIHNSKATLAQVQGAWFASFQHQLLAGEYIEAHRTLLYRLIPNLAFEPDLSKLRNLLSLVANYPLPLWADNGGSLYKDFVTISTALSKMVDSETVNKRIRFDMQSHSALERSISNLIEEANKLIVKLKTTIPPLYLPLGIEPGLVHLDAVELVKFAISDMISTLHHQLIKLSRHCSSTGEGMASSSISNLITSYRTNDEALKEYIRDQASTYY